MQRKARRPGISKNLQVGLIGVAMVVLLTQFNNCGEYAQPNNATAGASSVSCTTATCVLPDPNNLKIMPHLGNGEYAVPAGLSEFNLGGDCNEGGYPYNTVHWDLVLNGVVVRSSAMQVTGTYTAESKCINGRYLLYINLAPINQDNVDRTGLSMGNGYRASYNLNVTIFGQTVPNGQTFQTLQSVTVIPLTAI